MSIQRAVVTGGTGVLGTALIQRLVQAGIDVFVVCRPNSPRGKNIPCHELIHRVECDISNIKLLPDLIKKQIDAFFHLAWAGTQGQSRMNMYLQNANVKYALDTVYIAHELGCKVYIGAGSQAEYGRVDGMIRPDSPTNPISGYGMAKLCAGQMTRTLCKKAGIRHIWTRILSLYGLNDSPTTLIQSVIHSLLQNETPALTLGEQIWDYLYAGDAAEAFYRMALDGKSGKIYVLGSGKARKLRTYIEELRDVIDKSAKLGFGEIPYYSDQAMHLEADISELKQDLQWEPQTDFKKGVSTILSCYKHHPLSGKI